MSQHQQQTTWAEPPWSGWIETTGDALLILEAARRGLIPRVTRRLVDAERKMITSGSVFVFDEEESGIKRWTDGFFWSPSRILGNFLLYRETDKKGAGHRPPRSESNDDESAKDVYTLSRPKGEEQGVDTYRERILVGSLTNSFKFKHEGLMKKTFSLTIAGVSQHLISYYKIADVESGRLRSPSSLPELSSLDISPEYLDKTHFRNPPKVEIVDGTPRYRGEADELDGMPEPPPTSSSIAPGLPLLSEGRVTERPLAGSRRPKPYDQPAAPKRPRKVTLSPPASVSPPLQAAALPAPVASTSYSDTQYASYGIPTGFYQYPMNYPAQTTTSVQSSTPYIAMYMPAPIPATSQPVQAQIPAAQTTTPSPHVYYPGHYPAYGGWQYPMQAYAVQPQQQAANEEE